MPKPRHPGEAASACSNVDLDLDPRDVRQDLQIKSAFEGDTLDCLDLIHQHQVVGSRSANNNNCSPKLDRCKKRQPGML